MSYVLEITMATAKLSTFQQVQPPCTVPNMLQDMKIKEAL